jgi:hypothetical protein
MTTATLKCPECDADHTAEGVLDACTVSWPNQRWLHFKCPACKEYSHVELDRTTPQIHLGGLDGAPGPCFFPDSTASVSDLKVSADGRGIEVQYAGRKWFFKARR